MPPSRRSWRGSAGGRAANLAVYATSNRRHLVKETLSDRTGDDLHEADTRQELLSLSARFGLIVTFQRPDKALYSQILLQLAKQYQIPMPSDLLITRGEAFAIRAGGRSPRACPPVHRAVPGRHGLIVCRGFAFETGPDCTHRTCSRDFF